MPIDQHGTRAHGCATCWQPCCRRQCMARGAHGDSTAGNCAVAPCNACRMIPQQATASVGADPTCSLNSAMQTAHVPSRSASQHPRLTGSTAATHRSIDLTAPSLLAMHLRLLFEIGAVSSTYELLPAAQCCPSQTHTAQTHRALNNMACGHINTPQADRDSLQPCLLGKPPRLAPAHAGRNPCTLSLHCCLARQLWGPR